MTLPYQNLEKGVVLQEKAVFNKTPLNVKACCELLTKVLVLINRGEHFTQTEATDLFFAVTKLFQSQDVLFPFFSFLLKKRSFTDLFPFCFKMQVEVEEDGLFGTEGTFSTYGKFNYHHFLSH